MKLFRLKPDILLLLIFIGCVSLLTYCYPTAQLTWDSYYYLEIANDMKPSLRPGGYPFFLHILGSVYKSFSIIVISQYCLYFLSIWFFLRVLDYFFRFTTLQYILLGILFIVEPVGLYHCFNVLSDVLFSALTLGYIATLLLYTVKRSRWVFVAHLLCMFAAIEVRHIALFYPFFSFVLLLYFHRSFRLGLVYAVVIFGPYFLLNRYHVNQNEKYYKVRVYSPFSGWTHANNTLYGLHLMKLDTAEISDPEIKALHTYFTRYMDTSGYYPVSIGSGFLWDDKSPLCVLRQKMQDSLGITFVEAWYKLAPSFGKYGLYMQKHFPLQYIQGFMKPNTATLIKPHDGEMLNYYATPDMNKWILEWYHRKPSDFFARKQIYSEHINHWNTKYYQLKLALFILASVFLAMRFRRMGKTTLAVIIPLTLFVYAFYALTWYSSWFMQRYMIPVFPLEISVIFLAVLSVAGKLRPPEEPAKV